DVVEVNTAEEPPSAKAPVVEEDVKPVAATVKTEPPKADKPVKAFEPVPANDPRREALRKELMAVEKTVPEPKKEEQPVVAANQPSVDTTAAAGVVAGAAVAPVTTSGLDVTPPEIQ